MTNSTRQERRDLRQGRFVTAKEARLAAQLARLDYKVSGETGAMRIPIKARIQVSSGSRNMPARTIGTDGDHLSEAKMARSDVQRNAQLITEVTTE